MIILFKTYSVVSEASHLRLAKLIDRGGVCEDFVNTALKSVTTRRTGAHNWRWLKCLKSDRRTGKYAAMCLVRGDKGCLVAMVVVGCSVFCLPVVLGPSGSLLAQDWYLLVLVVLVDHSGVPVLAGHFLCKWCFPIYVYQQQYLLSCYPTVALLAFTYLKILWVV